MNSFAVISMNYDFDKGDKIVLKDYDTIISILEKTCKEIGIDCNNINDEYKEAYKNMAGKIFTFERITLATFMHDNKTIHVNCCLFKEDYNRRKDSPNEYFILTPDMFVLYENPNQNIESVFGNHKYIGGFT